MATSLAAKIKSELGIAPELIEGGNGIFDVVADGKMIFSKYKEGRFPSDEEVIDRLRK